MKETINERTITIGTLETLKNTGRGRFYDCPHCNSKNWLVAKYDNKTDQYIFHCFQTGHHMRLDNEFNIIGATTSVSDNNFYKKLFKALEVMDFAWYCDVLRKFGL